MGTKNEFEMEPRSKLKEKKKEQGQRENDSPVSGWEEVAPFPPTFGARTWPLAPKFASPSSVRMGSVLGALAGDAPRGGVVDECGVLGVALSGCSCRRPSPAATARSVPKESSPAHVDEEWVVNARWGLRWGLRLGLLSGLLSNTSGAFEVPTGGWLPAEALAFFATRWASISASLRR